jgi:FkbM family methyltransferase
MNNIPLIITGMHRSGTSLTASFFQELGITMGADLYRADRNNQRGYFEDLDFLEFQRRILIECSDRDSPGWADWGWTESENLDRQKFFKYRQDAESLISKRELGTAWGWKDPRTTLMLDFWQELIPDARFLLVYRYPWDVADSILRLNAPVFSTNPDYPLRIWQYYNQALLDFYRLHADRCILVSINGFLGNCDRLLELLEAKFDLKIPKQQSNHALAKVYDAQLFGELDWQHPTAQGIQQLVPESLKLLGELDYIADLPSPFLHSQSSNKQHPSPQHPSKALLQLHYLNQNAKSQSAPAEIDKNTKYDREAIAVMQKVLRFDSNCIDVGCHAGDILIEILKFAPKGCHYAFEPLPNYYQDLLTRFKDNLNVKLFDLALSDSERETSFLFVESNPAFSGLQKRKYFRNNLESEEKIIELKVKTQCLDRIVPEDFAIDLIKIDVEGAELEVLKGAIQTIKRSQPVVIFEHGMGAADYYGTKPEMIWELLVTECQLVISTMERFLENPTDTNFSKTEFCRHFNQGVDYYFIAYKADFDYSSVQTQREQELANQVQRLNEYRIVDRAAIAQLVNEIAAMRTSKFWRLRQMWFWLKRLVAEKKT